ncbi:ATP-binding cassette domain-containing protein [Chthonobacter albigriseus]|uniref:ATP-binding cassette domain-containing protein n=1 Tax=Chthonobacter albigriseus TaxID=1683161 RepID=UPI0015EF6170|nr:ATP-binding cassette domain-containing protein [Chthonobacter albigriseus]
MSSVSERAFTPDTDPPADGGRIVGLHPIAALERLGLEVNGVRPVGVPLRSVTPVHLPGVLVLADGTGLPIRGLGPDGRFQLDTGDGLQSLSLDSLAAVYGGTVLTPRVRRPASSKPERQTTLKDGATGPDALADAVVSRGLFRTLLRQTAKSGLAWQLCLAALISNVLGFALPLYNMAIYDRVIPHGAVETLWALTLGIALVFLVDLVSRIVRNRLQEAVGLQINLDLQNALYTRLTRGEMADAQASHGSVNTSFQTVEALCLATPAIIAGLLIDLPFVTISLVYVGLIAGWIVAVPIAAIGLIVGVGLVAHARARRTHAEAAQSAVKRANLIEETVALREAIKTTTSGPMLRRLFDDLVDQTAYSGHLARMSSAVATQVTAIIAQATTVLSLAIGVFLIMDGLLTVGALVASAMLVNRAVSPISGLVAGIVRIAGLSEGAKMAERLCAVRQETAGDAGRKSARRIRGSIAFNTVQFTYPGEPAPALQALSFSIAPGERVGVVGRIGSGKSTLVKLIPRLYSAEKGAILVDDHEIRQYDPDQLRRDIAYMPQDCDLFDMSIRENITLGLDGVDDEIFEEAVRIAGVHDIASRHPSGYGFKVGPQGRRLSGGERQAVALARTLVRDAPVLILDEPTAAMDSQFERLVIDRLRPSLAGRTVVISTHRAPILSLVDRIIWLDRGKIIADGPAAEVIRQASGGTG